MSKINNGGSAFPLPLGTANCSEPEQSGGMSLRDWFAATVPLDAKITDKDLAEMIVGRPLKGGDGIEFIKFGFDIEARMRYMKADAMLKERERK